MDYLEIAEKALAGELSVTDAADLIITDHQLERDITEFERALSEFKAEQRRLDYQLSVSRTITVEAL